MKDLNISAQFIKGVGPSRLKLLNKLGINTIEDILYCFPRRYEDRSRIKHISEIKPGNFETIKVKALSLGTRISKKGMNIFQMAVGDGTGVIYATWFNQPYMKDKFKEGQELILYGKIEKYHWFQISSPDYEILTGTKEDSAHMGRIVPIYPLTENLNQRWFRNILKFSVDNYVSEVADILPFDIRRRNNLIALKEAVKNCHFPVSEIVLKRARERLVFDELFILMTAVALKRAICKMELTSYPHTLQGALIEKFKNSLPFELTKSQKKVIDEIIGDMKKSRPMNRLLQGDVGSGKTIVSLFALLLAVENGNQAVLMAPTEILAEQHFNSIKKFFKDMDVRVVLIAGDLKASERSRRRHMIEVGEADIIVGTHSIIQEGVNFRKLALIVIDEQHKFGVMQKLLLKSKAENPHILVMTATPIPRTLALTVYGDLDTSVIDELPPGRKSIQTLYFEEKNRQKVYAIAEAEVKAGRQVYVVYPIISESEKSDLRAAIQMHKELKEMFPGIIIELLHGRMKSQDKDKIMDGFRDNKINILVSTIVIEVGVDVPNATCMVIEHAERFGLSQLHQLRGRVGRGGFASYCILIANPKTEDSVRRIQAMLKTQDGFKIAEEDLSIRGPGEFFGTEQHGFPELKIADIVRDRKILEVARHEAFEMITEDRFLIQAEHQLIKNMLRKKFNREELELVNVA